MTDLVRVRFAPSPTGSLHTGGARTALFNYLFARHNGGTLVLRSEDTDLERSSPAHETSIAEDLRWLGLTWDEGPDVGGSFGPYRQTERQDRYALAIARLVEIEAIYPCYCTPGELEAERAAQERRGEAPKYSGKCRKLSRAQRAELEAAGRVAALRFAMPVRDIYVEDLIRGSVHFPAGTLGDFIVLRPNKTPTYNFAVVVDDSDMAITHVIRADEHLPNTPRQVALFEALERPLPLFAHVSMILAPDHRKLSKRHGARAVSEYRGEGYLPEALVNYLALLGWSPGDDREFFTLSQLTQAFSLERASKSPAVFDEGKLRWFNAHYLRQKPLPERASLFARAASAGAPPALADQSTPDWWERFAAAVSDHVEVLGDVPREVAALQADEFPWNPDTDVELVDPPVRAMLEEMLAIAASAQAGDGFADAVSKDGLRALGERHGLKGRSLFRPLRLAVTGSEHGIELPLLLPLLGARRVAKRIASSLQRSQGTGQE
jgi:nondiscriminating glutamyl-tRNA synthetase